MTRQRTSSSGPASWYDPSQVFADTQRVDLFNDPPWEATLPPSPRRTSEGRARDTSWWASAKTAVVGRVAVKRGQHSHKIA